MLQQLIHTISNSLASGSCEILVKGYQRADKTCEDVRLRLHKQTWYGELMQQTTQWLQAMLDDVQHPDWVKLGEDRAEATGAVQRALEKFQQKNAGAADAVSIWQPAVNGPVGDNLQLKGTDQNVIYLRNVSKLPEVELQPGTGTPAARLQRISPLFRYNTMLRLEPGKFETVEVL